MSRCSGVSPFHYSSASTRGGRALPAAENNPGGSLGLTPETPTRTVASQNEPPQTKCSPVTKSLAEENSRRGIYSELDFLTRVYRHLHFEIITAKCPIRHAACVSAKLRKFQRARAVTDRWRRGNQPEFNIGSINPLAADSDGSNIDVATKEYHTLKIATF